MRTVRFVDNVNDYMQAADVLVTKPGGRTTAEALIAQIPIVLCKPLPGQEERNARVLVEASAAVRTRRVADLAETVELVLADRDLRERMLVAARRLGRPNAAGEGRDGFAYRAISEGDRRMNLPPSRSYAGWLALVRILTGVIWLLHAIPKFLNGAAFLPPDGFFTTYLQRGIATTAGPYHDFLVNVIQPNAAIFAELVRFGELLVGISLVLGLFSRMAVFFGIVLTIDYMAGRGALGTLNGWGSLDERSLCSRR